MRRTFKSLTLALALMLLALPAAATPGVGAVSPRSSIVAKVMDAFAGLWRAVAVAPEVTASPASEAREKDGDDEDRGGFDTPPFDGVGAGIDPYG